MIDPKDLDYIFDNVDFTEIRNARIFLTGGSGFFGKWITATLKKAGIEFDVLSRTSTGTIQGDVRSFSYPQKKYTDIIYLASESDIRHTLEFARICGCKRFLFTSSGAVYGVTPPFPISEETQPLPTKTPGSQKYYAERLLADFAESYKIDYKIARCFSFVGAEMTFGWYAMGRFIKNVLEEKPIKYYDIGAVRSYMYMADLVIWLLTILTKGHGVYNVGSEKSISIVELATLIGDMYDLRVYENAPPEKFEGVLKYVPCTKKARKNLGLREKIKLGEAIERTVNSMR
jgi:dTDP-glucose 4,6-dehydratase